MDKDEVVRGEGSSLLMRASSDSTRHQTTSDLVLQWGNRKRLRCMKVQVKDHSSGSVQRTTVRVDRRVVRTDNKDSLKYNNITNTQNKNNGFPNLRQQRIIRFVIILLHSLFLLVMFHCFYSFSLRCLTIASDLGLVLGLCHSAIISIWDIWFMIIIVHCVYLFICNKDVYYYVLVQLNLK
ncbi:hypothetical protein Lalb_Chr11g0063091 [Lupinus albus]|uniref:Transmembrane protein n=1 Tax=Lupinus albus TaxID=3870 RepID=A0A6A4PQW2_LUPAL|nr:hypothetical protein Lalb_Chr11g0063091 [Lupinus albus]